MGHAGYTIYKKQKSFIDLKMTWLLWMFSSKTSTIHPVWKDRSERYYKTFLLNLPYLTNLWNFSASKFLRSYTVESGMIPHKELKYYILYIYIRTCRFSTSDFMCLRNASLLCRPAANQHENIIHCFLYFCLFMYKLRNN